MKLIIKISLIIILAYFLEKYFPWWTVALASFLVNVLISGSNSKSFLSGFLGIGLLWMTMAIWIDISTNSILTERMAQVIKINDKYLLILATVLIGALVGGMGGLCGSTFKKLFEKKKNQY